MKDGDILPLEFLARREDWSEGVSLYARQRTVAVGTSFAQPLQFGPAMQPNYRPAPLVTLEIHAAQQLMDELWRCGLRPTEGTGSAGALAATQKHLEDMRTLVLERWMPGQAQEVRR